MAIVVQNNNNNENPFESIRRIDEHGNEYWYAKELLTLLGYQTWRRQKDTVERAIIACQNSGFDSTNHIVEVVQMAQIGGTNSERAVVRDYKLSRYGAYLSAMNGDPRKPEIAAAQSYFAISTHEAEVKREVEPQQTQGLLNPVYNEAIDVHLRAIDRFEKGCDFKLAQLLKSSLANIVTQNVQALPSADKPVVEQYEGVVEVATRLGYRVTPNFESALGNEVKKVCGELIRERNERWSSTSGIKVSANMYPAYHPEVEDAVKSYCIKKGFYRRPDINAA
jgi:hypothetical protein